MLLLMLMELVAMYLQSIDSSIAPKLKPYMKNLNIMGSGGHVLACLPGDFHEWLVEACWSTVKKLPMYGWHEAQIPGVSKLAVVGGHGNPVPKNQWKFNVCRRGSWGSCWTWCTAMVNGCKWSNLFWREAFQSLEATWILCKLIKLKVEKWQMQVQKSNISFTPERPNTQHITAFLCLEVSDLQRKIDVLMSFSNGMTFWVLPAIFQWC